MIINLTFDLMPITKARKDSTAWEIQCQDIFHQEIKKFDYESIVPKAVDIKFYFYNSDFSLNETPMYEKPDLDNLVKKILDVLFKHKKRDDFLPCCDQTISKICAEKLYTDTNSRIELVLETLN